MGNPAFSRKDLPQNFNRRMSNHDYRQPGLYHITILKNPLLGAFSTVSHPYPDGFYADVTELGAIIQRALVNVSEIDARLQEWSYIVMPDHVHILLQVKEKLDRPLGTYIARLKGRISRSYWTYLGVEKGESVFAKGFNDRIIKDARQRERVRKYIIDNPRRLWLKQTNRQFFSLRREVEISGKIFEAIGNIFLLEDFDIGRVRFSSRYTASELEGHRRDCWFRIQNRGVLVSPYYHPWEQQVRQAAIDFGARIVVLQHCPFGERFKPSGQLFDLCQQGRALILAPKEGRLTEKPTREEALALNRVAEQIEAGDFRVL